jgi:hypothetical protein
VQVAEMAFFLSFFLFCFGSFADISFQGTLYNFSVYAPSVKNELDYGQNEIGLIGAMGNAGTDYFCFHSQISLISFLIVRLSHPQQRTLPRCSHG